MKDDIDYDRNAKFVILQMLHKLCTENELKLPVTFESERFAQIAAKSEFK